MKKSNLNNKKYSKSKTSPNWYIIIYAIILDIVIFLMGLIPYLISLKYTETVVGKVTKINLGIINKFTAEYIVDNKTYTKEFSINIRNSATRSVGENIPLYYQKNNPENVSRTSKESTLTLLIIMSSISFVGVILIIYFYIRYIR